jgi:hypothetical protein
MCSYMMLYYKFLDDTILISTNNSIFYVKRYRICSIYQTPSINADEESRTSSELRLVMRTKVGIIGW